MRSILRSYNNLIHIKQGYQYHKLRKTFSKFYRRYYDLISKFQVGLKTLLRQGLLEPEFYGGLVSKLKKIVGSNNFSAQFIKIISNYKKIGYNVNVLQRTACLVVGPVTVGSFAFLFNCMSVGWISDYDSSYLGTCLLMRWWGPGALSGLPGFACWVSFAPVCCCVLVFASSLFNPRRSRRDIVLALSVRSHFLSVRNHISVPIGQI